MSNINFFFFSYYNKNYVVVFRDGEEVEMCKWFENFWYFMLNQKKIFIY